MGKQARKPRKVTGPGRKPGQGVPAALAAVRHKTQFGAPDGPKRCKHCDAFAMAGQSVCRMHGGAPVAARRGDYVPVYRHKRGQTLKPSLELRETSVWQRYKDKPRTVINELIRAYENRASDQDRWNEFVRG